MTKIYQQIVVAFLALTVYVKDVTSAGCLSEVDDIDYPKSIRSDLYRGEQAFTVSMLDAINKATPNENIFFSPYSTYHALLLAYFGARNETEAELIKALNLNWPKNKNHVRQAYIAEKKSRKMRSDNSPIDFASADRIFFSKEATLHECMRDIFSEELQVMDFRSNPEQCRMEINSWIANVTRNEIPEVLNAGDIATDTNLVLGNAAYFKGQWEAKFDAKDTTKEVFYTSSNKQTFVDMMHINGTYALSVDERLRAHVLEMPYLSDKKGGISMVIILPPFEPNSLDEVLKRLTPDTLNMALKEGMAREIEISLPKFEFEQNIELLPILNKMGINQLFGPNADLSGFSVDKQLSLGDAKHVAKIKVDEEGSTAAAATVLFSFRSARPIEPTKFECNHPFLFLIYDHKTQAILFTGIYRDPMTQK
ncbi:serine protease inhibitor 88Ea [Episyrphus balteatus]|uniref:serine protease inhibitor 88Ea n=1 Tax=Episyrphus balteatus TaxID=286459 RepID=UPI0024866843|nr:serine protease inhibitor 88Ea [Episyrphus balteatus]XP_055848012.1 serine protease inhibitor 88Ea [Episyrphus balteatus]XP_055848014.1 serine protease inhibitor 88Ea [Episyrphus balteatus]